MNSIHKTEIEARLLSLCETHLGPLGLRAVDVDVRVAGKSLVRVFIEKPVAQKANVAGKESIREWEKATGVSIDDCAEASRVLGPVIDSENLVPSAYDLEVSSPGVERRLRTFQDFTKVVGEEVKLKLVTDAGTEKGPVIVGQLIQADGEGIAVKAPGAGERNIPLSKIRQANLIWRF